MHRDDTATHDQRHAAAERRVNQLAGWTIHLLAFVLVNAGLFTQSGFDPAAGHFWGWGLGLAAHTVAVVGPGPTIKDRLIRHQLRRDSGHPNS